MAEMPPKDKCQVTRCVAHRMFNKELVAFIQFAKRPPRDIIDMMRLFGNYRKEPWEGAGAGWYVSRCNLGQLHDASKELCPDLAKKLVTVAETIVHDPQTIACPSRDVPVSQTGSSSRKKKRRYASVNKVGHS